MRAPVKAQRDALYPDPIGRLLTIGEPGSMRLDEWRDYIADFSLNAEHIPDLIRMAIDADLLSLGAKRTEFWAPVHAWRSLGQLGAEAAIEPLAAYMEASREDDDWVANELPHVFAMIGLAAIPRLVAVLDDRSRCEMAATTAIDGLKEIAERYPEAKADCVASLTRLLRHRAGANPFTNGCAVAALADLHAVESIDAIRDAYQWEIVDLAVMGDIEDVEIEFGLRTTRATPAKFNPLFPGHTPDMFKRPVPHAPRAITPKVGRNDPCPCGSGKKYKKCCL